MPDLTITNLTRSTLPTQGSFGPLSGGETRTRNLTVSQIEMLRPLLTRLESQGFISWNVGGYNNTDPDAEFVTFEDASSIMGGGPPTGPASGDLGGAYPDPDVVGLQGTPVDTTAPVLNEILQFDGTSWAPGPAPASGDTKAYDIVVGNSLAGDTADEVDFLDPGDGSGVAAAIASIPAQGATVYIRRGTYSFNQPGSPALPMTVPGSVVIMGGGKENTFFEGSTTQRSFFDFSFAFDTILKDLRINMPAAAAGASGTSLFIMDFADGFELRDVFINFGNFNANETLTQLGSTFLTIGNNFRDCVFNFNGSSWPTSFIPWNLEVEECYIENVQVGDGSSGLRFFLFPSANNLSMNNVWGTVGCLFDIRSSRYVRISNCKVEGEGFGSPTTALLIQQSQDVTVSGCVIQASFPSPQIGIHVNQTNRCVISGCVVNGAFNEGIRIINGANDNVVVGCSIQGYTVSAINDVGVNTAVGTGANSI